MEKESYIEKYGISKKDLWSLKYIETLKSESGFFEKEKLKKKSLAILKEYNVRFLDLGDLLKEIKNNNIDLIESEGLPNIEDIGSDSGHSYFSVVYIFSIIMIVFFSYMIFFKN